jgi:GNAT superfamily N-acetyltransferase
MNAIIRRISAPDTYALRHAVLWPDKPLAYVHIPEDEQGLHFGAFLADELVSVVSLFVTGADARFRKFATRPDQQGLGIGSALLRHLIREATQLGARRLWCDARADAADFYRKFNFAVEGEAFYKGSIPYVRMSRALPA